MHLRKSSSFVVGSTQTQNKKVDCFIFLQLKCCRYALFSCIGSWELYYIPYYTIYYILYYILYWTILYTIYCFFLFVCFVLMKQKCPRQIQWMGTVYLDSYIFLPSLISRHTNSLILKEYWSSPYLVVTHLNSLAFVSNMLKSKHFTAQIKHEM